MKNSIFTMAFIALFAVSCDKEEAAEVQVQNATAEKKSSFAETVSRLAADEEFRDFISSENYQRNNGSNGLMVIDSWNLGYTSFNNGILTIISGEGTIQALPNGRARFSIHTNNPSGAVIDFSNFSTLYSSDCVTGPLGTFNYNYISEYEVFTFGEAPFIFTFYFPTGVNASAQTANGHCNVNNSTPTYNDDWEIIGCGVATENKTIQLQQNGGLSLQ